MEASTELRPRRKLLSIIEPTRKNYEKDRINTNFASGPFAGRGGRTEKGRIQEVN